jgi:hypothetical protein
MKKINLIQIIATLLMAVAFTNCESFLDQPVKGKQVIDNYYSNEDECLKALAGCYATLSPEDWWETDFFHLVGDACSDDAFKGNSIEGDQRDFGNLAQFNINPQNEWIEIKWRYSYQMIYRTNLLIERVAEAPIPEDLIAQIVAEGKFLRSYGYFELIKNFGDVPLFTAPLTAEAPLQERKPMADVWAQIEKDLSEAAQVLPEKSEQTSMETGHATRGAALAFLAKAYVYQNKWNEAQSTFEQVISTGEYNLNDSFDRVWNIHNPNGTGSIFEIQNSFDNLYDTGSALPVLSRSRNDGGWGFCTPSSHLDNFMGDDPRRNLTIIKHGDYVDEDHPQYDTNLGQNETGRTNRKYYLALADRPTDSEHTRSGLNHILFRYADLLLLHAEAAWHNHDETAALNYLNEVRARVDLNPINSTGEELLMNIYNERRMELAMEGHRYYDLKRQDGISQPGSPRLKEVMEQFVDYNKNSNTDYDGGNDQGILFDVNKHTLFPVPQIEIDLSEGTLWQNPGY